MEYPQSRYPASNSAQAIAESLLQHRINGKKLGAILRDMKDHPGTPLFWPKNHSPQPHELKSLAFFAEKAIGTLSDLADGHEATEDTKRYVRLMPSLLERVEAGIVQAYRDGHSQQIECKIQSEIENLYDNESLYDSYGSHLKEGAVERVGAFARERRKDAARELAEAARNQPVLTRTDHPDQGLPNARRKLAALAQSIGTEIHLGNHAR